MAPVTIASLETLPREVKNIIPEFLSTREDLTNSRLINKSFCDAANGQLYGHLSLKMFMTDFERLETISNNVILASRVQNIEIDVVWLPQYDSFDSWMQKVKPYEPKEEHMDNTDGESGEASNVVGSHDDSEKFGHTCKFAIMRNLRRSRDEEGLRILYEAYKARIEEQEEFVRTITCEKQGSGRLRETIKRFPNLLKVDIISGSDSSFASNTPGKIELETLCVMDLLSCLRPVVNQAIHVETFEALQQAQLQLRTFSMTEAPMPSFSTGLKTFFSDNSIYKSLTSIQMLFSCPEVPMNRRNPVTGKGIVDGVLASATKFENLTIGIGESHGCLLSTVTLRELFPPTSDYYKGLKWVYFHMIQFAHEDFVYGLACLEGTLTELTLYAVKLLDGDWIGAFQMISTMKLQKIHFDSLYTTEGVWSAIPCGEGPCQGNILPEKSLFMRMWKHLLEGDVCPLESQVQNPTGAKTQWIEQSDDTLNYRPYDLDLAAGMFGLLPMGLMHGHDSDGSTEEEYDDDESEDDMEEDDDSDADDEDEVDSDEDVDSDNDEAEQARKPSEEIEHGMDGLTI